MGGGGRGMGCGAAGDPRRGARARRRGREWEARRLRRPPRVGPERRGAGAGASGSLAGPTLTDSPAPGARASYSRRQRRPGAAPPTAHAPSARAARARVAARGRGRAGRRGRWRSRRLRVFGAAGAGEEAAPAWGGPTGPAGIWERRGEAERDGPVLFCCLFLFSSF